MKEADFVECIIAPSYSKEALEIFSKKKNLRIMEVPNFNNGFKEFDSDMKKVDTRAPPWSINRRDGPV